MPRGGRMSRVERVSGGATRPAKRNIALQLRAGRASDPDGIRTTAVSCGKDGGSQSGRQQNRQHSDEITPPAKPADPELAAVVAAWSDLPPAVRAGIVAMVRAAKP